MKAALLSAGARWACERAPFPPAVILGTNVTGLAEARPLAAHGIPVIGVDERVRRYTSYSSAWTGLIVTDEFNGPGLV
ncbi:MAG: hypothetical protein ABIZ91_01105, partial [Gemmatimonadaceae bacterium]